MNIQSDNNFGKTGVFTITTELPIRPNPYFDKYKKPASENAQRDMGKHILNILSNHTNPESGTKDHTVRLHISDWKSHKTDYAYLDTIRYQISALCYLNDPLDAEIDDLCKIHRPTTPTNRPESQIIVPGKTQQYYFVPETIYFNNEFLTLYRRTG